MKSKITANAGNTNTRKMGNRSYRRYLSANSGNISPHEKRVLVRLIKECYAMGKTWEEIADTAGHSGGWWNAVSRGVGRNKPTRADLDAIRIASNIWKHQNKRGAEVSRRMVEIASHTAQIRRLLNELVEVM